VVHDYADVNIGVLNYSANSRAYTYQAQGIRAAW